MKILAQVLNDHRSAYSIGPEKYASPGPPESVEESYDPENCILTHQAAKMLSRLRQLYLSCSQATNIPRIVPYGA